MLIQSLKSVVVVSPTPDATAAFYRDTLGLPLETEQHRGTQRHHAGSVGNVHFAVHDEQGFWLPAREIVSFTVEDLDAMAAQLTAHGVEILARQNIGPMKFIAVRDPDGRYVCFGTPWPTRR